jgi:hypothetical protein
MQNTRKTKRQKVTKHMRNDDAILPAPVSQLMEMIEKRDKITKTEIDGKTGWRVTTVIEEKAASSFIDQSSGNTLLGGVIEKDNNTIVTLKDVAFQIDDTHAKSSAIDDMFWWKFASELDCEKIPYRGHSCAQEWYEIKEVLENEMAFNRVKQNKKNLRHASLLAFRYTDWKLVHKKGDILAGLHQPLQGHDRIAKDEKIVLMRLPGDIVKTLYTDVEVLQLDETLTEEERMQRVLDFDGGLTKPKRQHQPPHFGMDYSKRPPLGYHCHNCGSNEHFVHQCTFGRRMRPTGIPKMFLEKSDIVSEKDNAMLLEDGTVVKARLLINGKMQ